MLGRFGRHANKRPALRAVCCWRQALRHARYRSVPHGVRTARQVRRVAAEPERHLDEGAVDGLFLACRGLAKYACREMSPD